MKALSKMTTIEKADLLAKLFPEELQILSEYMAKEAELFQVNKELVYKQWTEGLIDADFWYRLIANFQRKYTVNGKRLYKNTRTFSNQVFDGYDALFAIHSLIHYTEQQECTKKLRYAIYLLFGETKLVTIPLNP